MDTYFPDADHATATAGFMGALFEPSGVSGVHARTDLHEKIVDRLAALITTLRPTGAEVLRFPPVMPRGDLEKSGYLASFPNLLGCVCALSGTDAEIEAAAASHGKGGDWTSALAASDLVLAPAACYPVYPLAARRGALPPSGLCFDVACECFRREPSERLDRLQSFRMREYVCIGSAEQVLAFRQDWIEKGRTLAARLGLPAEIAPANDPFFGREGRMKAVSQIHQAAKFELLVPVYATKPTACMSFNYHRDHFGNVWSLRSGSGETAHTGCAAFGMDRLALALFATHGLDTASWPADVQRALAL
jgi:seryl-tRNA synthetase